LPITAVYPPPPIVPADTPFELKCSLPLQEIDVELLWLEKSIVIANKTRVESPI